MGAPTSEELRLLEKWEDLRQIKNLMGRYVLDILNSRHRNIVAERWSVKRNDICYGVNAGWYVGREAVAGLYEAKDRLVSLKAALLKNAFPEKLMDKSVEELRGAGPFFNLPNSTPLIEIAEDGGTAKAIWYCHGSYADLESTGIQSHWTWGYYTADLVKEDGQWRFWHLAWLNDIDTLCGQTWVKENVPYPEEEDFKCLKAPQLPEPNRPGILWEYYTPRRRFAGTPRLPEPYKTFSETFSYGPEEVAV